MDRPYPPLLPLALLALLFLCLLHGERAAAAADDDLTSGTGDGSELWGYVQVRPKAHLFWWYYKSPQRASSPGKPWPTILWLQGGPGASGVGLGNFLEVGPLDVNLKPRDSTWLQKADLIFVDNPVGVGYSYADDPSALVTTDWQAATDATELLRALAAKEIPTLQSSPLFLVAESYGGKYAATLGVSLARAIRAGDLKLNLGGVALGDSWISPEDFTLAYTPLLLEVSRLDDNAGDEASKMAATVKEQITAGQLADSQQSWIDLLGFIDKKSASVDMYNFLLDSGMDPVSADLPAASSSSPSSSSAQLMKYSTYLSSQAADSGSNTIDGIMNGVIKEKLKIIPKNLKWQELSDPVYNALVNDFMKPRINEIDELLSYGINVTVYNGQLDVICSTIGAEAWVKKLKWDGLKNFLSLPRQPLKCGSSKGTKAFVRSYKNLHFYWILGAGHFVPADQPCIALSMISSITQSPAS
ncbi:serine carboxypeptidase-like 51 [Oryza glaberrima]|uniref:Carboxypeptidase n=1 Tax=Oryza glaberrima TaxID=4538 RepID=I1PBZ7_ORYGL|nr:serine carboxypeptidase-like 51 [Oryza glaberrima]